MSDKLIWGIMDLLKLHEPQIVNVGAHDEEESKRRRRVRKVTATKILSLARPEIEREERERIDKELAHVETLHENYRMSPMGSVEFRANVISFIKELRKSLKGGK